MPLENTPAALAGLKKEFPTGYLATIQPAANIAGVKQAQTAMFYDYTIFANADVKADRIKQITKLIAENKAALAAGQPNFRGLEVERMYTDINVPYHDGAVAYYREKVLLDQYLTGIGKKAVTEEAAKKLYDDTTKAMAPEEEAHARHILVETEDQAKAVEERLKKGEDFAKVATDVSKDPGSGKEGGDLGWFTKDRMVPEFAEAAFKLKKGEVSAPVKSQFGWHVIKLEDKRTKPLPEFSAVRPQIEQYLERKAQQDTVLALREKAKVERLDKPAAPATPAPDAAKPAEPKKN